MLDEAIEPQEILDEEVDGNYEPTQQEIQDYATWLGMDLEEEKDLMWIALEGLKAPLPESWKPCKTPKGDVYYFNFSTGESIWDHPCDEHFRKLYKEEKEKLQQRKKAEAGKRAGLGQRAQAGRLPSPNPTAKPASGKLSGELGGDRQAGSGKPPLAAVSATSLAAIVDPRERRKLNRQHSKSGLSSVASSLHSSFDSDNALGGNSGAGGVGGGPKEGSLSNSREILAPLKGVLGATGPAGSQGGLGSSGSFTKASPLGPGSAPLGGPLSKIPPLGSVPASPSASGSDWPAINAPPQHLGTLKVSSKERSGSLQGDNEAEIAEVERRHAERLNQLKSENAVEEAATKKKLEEDSELAMKDFKRQLQEREERERQELLEQQRQQLASLEEQHQKCMSTMKRQQDELEEELQRKVSKSQQGLADSSAFEEELASSKDAARAAALKEAKAEAEAWAEGQKVALRQEALEAVTEQVEEELLPLKEGKKAEVLGRATKEATAEAEQLLAQVSESRKQLSELEKQLSAKNAAARAAEADLSACKEQLPELEASMQAKRKEKADLDTEIAAQKPALKRIAEDLRSKQREAAEAEAKLEAYQHQLEPAARELERLETALYTTRKSMAAEEVELQKAKAQRSVEEQQLAGLKAAVQEKQAALEAAQASLASQQQELTKVTADLGKARSDMLTQDVTLATELRERAGAELHGLEEELSKCKKELQEVSTLLASRKSELALLEGVSAELQDKQKRLSAVSVQLSTCQADLAELESDLAAKRSQLDTVATLLTSKRKELSFEEQRTAISNEEKLLLEVERQRMERGVEEKVQAERAQLLSSKMEAVRVEAMDGPEEEDKAEKAGTAPQAAASKRPKLDTDLPASAGQVMDLSSSAVLLDSPVLPEEDVHDGAPGTAAGAKWWTQPTPAGSLACRGNSDSTHASIRQEAPWSAAPAWMHAPAANGNTQHARSPAQHPQPTLPQQQAAVLPKALNFIKQQKHFLKERSAMVQNAVAEWRVAMAAVEAEPDPVLRHQQSALLRGVKATLEEQAHRVNADTVQLGALKAQVRALEAQQGQSRARRSSSSRHSRAAWQTESEGDTDVQAYGYKEQGPIGSLDGVMGRSTRQKRGPLEHPSLRASIDKIGMALEDAVAAAVAQGMAAAAHNKGVQPRTHAPRSASAGHRRPPPPHTPLPGRGLHTPSPDLPHPHGSRNGGSGIHDAAGFRDGGDAGLLSMLHNATLAAASMGGPAAEPLPPPAPLRASLGAGMSGGGPMPRAPMPYGGPGPVEAAGLVPPLTAAAVPIRRQSADAAWASGFGGGEGGGGGPGAWEAGVEVARQSLAPSQLAFLHQWRDKSDMSEALLHQHATWLRGFREQVERGAASMAVRGRVAALNDELAGTAPPMYSGGGGPFSVDIGNGRVLQLNVRSSR